MGYIRPVRGVPAAPVSTGYEAYCVCPPGGAGSRSPGSIRL